MQYLTNNTTSDKRIHLWQKRNGIITMTTFTHMQTHTNMAVRPVNDWKKQKLEIKIARRNINNLRYADDTTLLAESEEELKSLLMQVKEESEKVGFKLNIQKTEIMASGPITSWEKIGETLETVSDFIFFGSKTTADGDCSLEIDAYSLEEKF